jgi:hypothetical protein
MSPPAASKPTSQKVENDPRRRSERRYPFRLKPRRHIPAKVKDRLMVANRHRCCICQQPRQPVEKHHINGDPNDNAWNNLAVVCRNCHGLVTQKGNLGAQYSEGEVLLFKLQWEERCKTATVDEIESPLEELSETIVIRGGKHEEYPFDMKRGQELVFAIDANDELDIVICLDEDIEEWLGGSDDDDDDDSHEEETDDDQDDVGDPVPPGEQRSLVAVGQFTTTIDQVALAFTAPSNLPPAQVYEQAIRASLERG